MTSCRNKVTVYVPRGWDYRAVEYTCGNTGVDGEAVLCTTCESRVESGAMLRPGYCKHGTRLHDDSDRDITCTQCEIGG